MKTIGLSKSNYCSAIQCPKMLWLLKNKPEEAADTGSELVFTNGNIVGDAARNYYGEYTLIEYSKNKSAMVDATNKAIATGEENIAEASFIYDGLYCAVDILHRNGDGYDIVEVKSSTSVKDIYIDDMSFQYYVLINAGVNVKNVFILYINRDYVRRGELNLSQLFIQENYTKQVLDKQSEVEKRISEYRDYLSQSDEPTMQIGPFCQKPYDCAYMGYCRGELPVPSVFDITRIGNKAYDLYNDGIVSFEDIISKKIKLSDNQMIQVKSFLEDSDDIIDIYATKKFLDTISYPLYHLDFETFQHAVPEFEGERPYEMIPFQYSLHIEYEDGRLEHKEFLAEDGKDPRRAIAESLCRDIPKGVCSLAYNMSFEKTRLKDLAGLFPDLSDHLMDIRANMHDLMIPFQKKAYYSKDMAGSYSIKYVLPALYPNDPELDYHNLDQVHNGGEASLAFLTMPNKSPEEKKELRENLLKYCGLDTYAMVKVLRKLKEVVE